MSEIKFNANSEEDTEKLAAALAGELPAGTMIALNGTLGAGKTRFVEAVATALGIERDDVTSPTFVMVQEYYGDKTIYHMDAYRVADDDEFIQLGAEEYFDSDGITFVEWAERVQRCLPPDRLEIRIEVTGDTEREFSIAAVGSLNDVVARTAKLLDGI